MSETLREEKGGDQVAEDQDTRDESDQVLRAHSRSTPCTTSSEMRKKRAVSPRYSTSSMRVLLGPVEMQQASARTPPRWRKRESLMPRTHASAAPGLMARP